MLFVVHERYGGHPEEMEIHSVNADSSNQESDRTLQKKRITQYTVICWYRNPRGPKILTQKWTPWFRLKMVVSSYNILISEPEESSILGLHGAEWQIKHVLSLRKIYGLEITWTKPQKP